MYTEERACQEAAKTHSHLIAVPTMKNDVCWKFLGLRLKKVQVCEEFIMNKYLFIPVEVTGLPWWLSDKESAC